MLRTLVREGQAQRETKEGFAELDIFDKTDELCFLLIDFVSHFLVVVSVEQCPLSLEATYKQLGMVGDSTGRKYAF